MTSRTKLPGSLLDSGWDAAEIWLIFPTGKRPCSNLGDEPSWGVRRGRRSISTNLNTTLVQSEPHLNPDALKQTTGHCHRERSQLSGSEGRVGPVLTQILRKPAAQMNPSPARLRYLNVCLTALTRRSIIFSRSSREQLRSSVLSGFKSRAVTFPNSSISRMIVSDLRK